MATKDLVDQDIALHWYKSLSSKDKGYIRDRYWPYSGGMLHSAIITAYREIKKPKKSLS